MRWSEEDLQDRKEKEEETKKSEGEREAWKKKNTIVGEIEKKDEKFRV